MQRGELIKKRSEAIRDSPCGAEWAEEQGCYRETICHEAGRGESISIKEEGSHQVSHSLPLGLGEKSILLASAGCQSRSHWCWTWRGREERG